MEALRIMSIEAKDVFGAMHQEGKENCEYSIRSSDGTLSLRKFSNTFDYSLDYMRLAEVYEKKIRRKDFSFRAGKHTYTKNVICITFKYAYKEFNMAGRNTYIRNGYVYRDCVFEDGVYVKDGKLIAIQTNVEVKHPVGDELLEGYFTFCNGYYKLTGTIPTIMDKAELRNELYKNGFRCDGIDYVRYKRSSGSSRVGKCLFVNKILADDMTKWDKCGLDIKEGQDLDLAAWEAYIALPMSSIIDTMEIQPENILVIKDEVSSFEDEVVAVEIEDNHLVSSQKRVTIENKLFDGQSLMDVSLFDKYRDKGMLLLRNRFFKSCCFNTNLQQWFADNNITSVSQLNGFTLATDISQIKLVTTPSSIKYAKFGKIEDWLRHVDPIFGIVKYEKKPHPFDGRMVQAHYQLFNTLQLSYEEMEQVLKPSLDYVSAIRSDPAVLRYEIKYPFDEEEEWSSLDSKNEIIFKLLGINDKFSRTKLYYDFRDDLVKGWLRNLKRGHVLVNGNYSTIMGNGMEMLKSAIGQYTGRLELQPGQIHSKRFNYGTKLLCSRSPHVTVGNVLLVDNVASEDYDTYFNLTPEIVCVNAANDNIQQRLNGADYDSDTMLITDNDLLIRSAQKHYDEFKVPTNLTTSVKTARKYEDSDKADLDVRTSVNKIGEIINLSQQLNSLMWERIHKGATIKDCMELYWDICKLAVLSNVEIDRAKKEFVINSTTELNILKRKYKITDDERTVKPYFFKMITTENGYSLSDNIKYRYFHTSMDYLQQIINKFHFREGRDKKRDVLPFMSIVKEPSGNVQQGYYYTQRDNIIRVVRAAKEETKRLYANYDELTPAEKEITRQQAWDVKQTCIEAISEMSSSQSTMYLVLRELDNPEFKDVARYVFEVLFGRPDQAFFTMIKDSKETVYVLEEEENGVIQYYDYRFNKVPLVGKIS